MRVPAAVACLSALVLGLLTLGGCAAWNDTVRSVTGWTADTVDGIHDVRSDDEPWTFEAPGPVAIDVELFAGDVVIHADSDEPTGRVEVARVATHGASRGHEAEASLDEMQVTADLVPGPVGPVLRIRSATTHAEPYFQRTDLVIHVPRAEGIRVHTTRGRVWVYRAAGPVDISTTSGDVRFMTPRALRDPIVISTDSGDIDLRMRGESTGAFDCRAVNGTVNNRIRYGRVRLLNGTTTSRLLATLNDGANPIALSTVDGDIGIAVVHNPMHVGTFIPEP